MGSSDADLQGFAGGEVQRRVWFRRGMVTDRAVRMIGNLAFLEAWAPNGAVSMNAFAEVLKAWINEERLRLLRGSEADVENVVAITRWAEHHPDPSDSDETEWYQDWNEGVHARRSSRDLGRQGVPPDALVPELIGPSRCQSQANSTRARAERLFPHGRAKLPPAPPLSLELRIAASQDLTTAGEETRSGPVDSHSSPGPIVQHFPPPPPKSPRVIYYRVLPIIHFSNELSVEEHSRSALPQDLRQRRESWFDRGMISKSADSMVQSLAMAEGCRETLIWDWIETHRKLLRHGSIEDQKHLDDLILWRYDNKNPLNHDAESWYGSKRPTVPQRKIPSVRFQFDETMEGIMVPMDTWKDIVKMDDITALAIEDDQNMSVDDPPPHGENLQKLIEELISIAKDTVPAPATLTSTARHTDHDTSKSETTLELCSQSAINFTDTLEERRRTWLFRGMIRESAKSMINHLADIEKNETGGGEHLPNPVGIILEWMQKERWRLLHGTKEEKKEFRKLFEWSCTNGNPRPDDESTWYRAERSDVDCLRNESPFLMEVGEAKVPLELSSSLGPCGEEVKASNDANATASVEGNRQCSGGAVVPVPGHHGERPALETAETSSSAARVSTPPKLHQKGITPTPQVPPTGSSRKQIKAVTRKVTKQRRRTWFRRARISKSATSMVQNVVKLEGCNPQVIHEWIGNERRRLRLGSKEDRKNLQAVIAWYSNNRNPDPEDESTWSRGWGKCWMVVRSRDAAPLDMPVKAFARARKVGGDRLVVEDNDAQVAAAVPTESVAQIAAHPSTASKPLASDCAVSELPAPEPTAIEPMGTITKETPLSESATEIPGPLTVDTSVKSSVVDPEPPERIEVRRQMWFTRGMISASATLMINTCAEADGCSSADVIAWITAFKQRLRKSTPGDQGNFWEICQWHAKNQNPDAKDNSTWYRGWKWSEGSLLSKGVVEWVKRKSFKGADVPVISPMKKRRRVSFCIAPDASATRRDSDATTAVSDSNTSIKKLVPPAPPQREAPTGTIPVTPRHPSISWDCPRDKEHLRRLWFRYGMVTEAAKSMIRKLVNIQQTTEEDILQWIARERKRLSEGTAVDKENLCAVMFWACSNPNPDFRNTGEWFRGWKEEDVRGETAYAQKQWQNILPAAAGSTGNVPSGAARASNVRALSTGKLGNRRRRSGEEVQERPSKRRC